uniref:Putative da-p36 protein n=1 Tax=Rhipicephalus pulchellus TaxID=72859 RepID=L7LRA1_RHIPC
MDIKVHITCVGYLVPLLVALCKGAVMENLTNVAEKYVGMRNNTGEVISWGFDRYYIYWHQTQQSKQGYPIYATTDDVKCTKNTSQGDEAQTGGYYHKCDEHFSLFIQNGIESPFRAYAYVDFPLFGERKNGIKDRKKVDLNNQTTIHVDIDLIGGTPYTQQCEFETTVYYNGYFAYYVRKEAVEDHTYMPVSVKELANLSNNLSTYNNELVYKVKGSYVQTLCK